MEFTFIYLNTNTILVMDEYFKWTRGDEEGVVEKLKDRDDDYYYFESGERISLELLEDYMVPTTADDEGRPRGEIYVYANPVKNDNQNVYNNNSSPVDSNNNNRTNPNLEKDIERYNKILKLSDITATNFKIETPDKKTLAIMEMSGIDIESILVHLYTEQLKLKIKEILNDEDNSPALQ